MMKMMMRLLLAVSLLLASTATAAAYTVGSNSNNKVAHQQQQQQQQSRREWLSSTLLNTAVTAFGLPAATLVGAAGVQPAVAATTDLTLFEDPPHGFSIRIPTAWSKSVQDLRDRRRIIVWSDPTDPRTALFIAYTPVRDDFTSLSSFGPVDQVAAQTILPKASLMGGDAAETVQAEMLSAVSAKQAYIFDYTQAVTGVQPPTHFRTIFTLQQGATGGAGAVLVTITLQTPEEGYATTKPLMDQIIDSYGRV